MQYEGDIIRPPSEADSILLQVATGCPHNACTFCGAYRDRSFRVKDDALIWEDLRWAAKHFPHKRRLFLCDGDGMAIPMQRLLPILQNVRKYLPWVTRVATYGSAQAVGRRSDGELAILREHGLSLVYMGLESGNDDILRAVGKAATAEEHVRQVGRLHNAGIKLSVSVILGLGSIHFVGRDAENCEEGWKVHAQDTGEVLSAMQPQQSAALSLMLVPNTPLFEEAEAGVFSLPDTICLLKELRLLLENITVPHGLFLANHASNHLPLRVRLPKGKADALGVLDAAIKGNVGLRSEWMRGL